MKTLEPGVAVRVALTLVVCGVIGGWSFVLIKELVTQVSPMHLVAGRVALAALVLVPVMLTLRRRAPVTVRVIRGAAVLSVADAIAPFLLIALAAPHLQASTSGLLASTMPLFTGLFVCMTDRVRLPVQAVFGLALGAAGVAVLTGPGALDFESSATLAIIAVLLSAACYAASAVYARGLLREIDPIGLSAIKFVIAAVVLVPFVMLREGIGVYSELTPTGWLALLALGGIVTGLARCGYVWVIAVAGSVSASLLTYMVPAAAFVLGWLFLDERLTWAKGIGAALVFGALTCTLFGASAWRQVRRVLRFAPYGRGLQDQQTSV